MNYLDYMAEPVRNKRINIGIVVIIYLGVLFVFAYALKRAYWKDIHCSAKRLGGRSAAPALRIMAGRSPHPASGENTMMTLYSGTTDPFSQRCRIVLHEKGMDFQIIDVDLDHKPEDLAVMNRTTRSRCWSRGPGAARVEHHQRVHRRAFPASAAHAR